MAKVTVPISNLLQVAAQAEKAERFPGDANPVVALDGDDILDSSTYAWELLIWVDSKSQTLTAYSQGQKSGGIVSCHCAEANADFGFQLLAESKKSLLDPLAALPDQWAPVELTYDESKRALGVNSPHHGILFTVKNILAVPNQPASIFKPDPKAKTLTTQGNLLAIAADHCLPMLFHGQIEVKKGNSVEKLAEPDILQGVSIYASKGGVFMAASSMHTKRFASVKLDASQVSSDFAVQMRHSVLKAAITAISAMVDNKDDLENIEVTITLNPDDCYQIEACLVEDGIRRFCIVYCHYSLPHYPKQFKQRFTTTKPDYSFHCLSFTSFYTSFAGMVAFSKSMEVPFVALHLDKELKAACPGNGSPFYFAVGGMTTKAFEVILKIENLKLVMDAIASHSKGSSSTSFTIEVYDKSIVITPKIGGSTSKGEVKTYDMGHQFVLRPIMVDPDSREMKAVKAAFAAPSPTRELKDKPKKQKSVAVDAVTDEAATDSSGKKSEATPPKASLPEPAAKPANRRSATTRSKKATTGKSTAAKPATK